MKITFKNVGQGDSIILEWHDKNSCRIGIIDCKKTAKSNPTLEYIKDVKPDKIDFIILSHPHMDHYSGMLELLTHCQRQNIKINQFAHSGFNFPNYLYWFEINEEECSLLDSIFTKCITLYNEKIINTIGYPTHNWSYKLNDDFTITCLAPSDQEFRLFSEHADLFKEQSNEFKARQSANFLSTIFLLHSKESGFLFTSDATIPAFDRLRGRHMDTFEQLSVLLGQIPHHGSKENHQIGFWQLLKREVNCPVVVSAGKHATYNHPCVEVISDYNKHNYKIYSTNFVNGLEDFMTKNGQFLSLQMDYISEIVETCEMTGDQTFEMTSNGLIYTT